LFDRLRHLLHKCPCLDLNYAKSALVGECSCGWHLNDNYEGVCIGRLDDGTCNSICINESSDNNQGKCDTFQCWCHGRCTFETEVVASPPIRQWYNDPRLSNDPVLPGPRLIIIIYNIVSSVYVLAAYLCYVVDLWVKIYLYFLVQILLTTKIGMSGKNRAPLQWKMDFSTLLLCISHTIFFLLALKYIYMSNLGHAVHLFSWIANAAGLFVSGYWYHTWIQKITVHLTYC
jgi:hypothetical protein